MQTQQRYTSWGYGAAYTVIVTTFALILAIGGVTPTAAQQPVSVSSSALPTGAATAANQTTANSSLSSIDGKLPSAATLADDTTNPSATKIAAYNMCFDGTTWDRCRASADTTSDSTAADTGPQIFALASTAAPTAVSASGDGVRFWADLNGRLQASPSATASTDSGASTCYFTSAASNNAQYCKASPGNLYDLHVINTTATVYYLRLYNLSAAPTCSSATGFIETIPIPSNSTSGAGVALTFPVGRAFPTGIAFCLTGGGSSTDNTNAASGVYMSFGYK